MPTNDQNPSSISSRSGRRWLHEAKKSARSNSASQSYGLPSNEPTDFQSARIDDAEQFPFSKPTQSVPQEIPSSAPQRTHEIVTVSIPFVGQSGANRVSAAPAPPTESAVPMATPYIQPIAEKSPPVTTNDGNIKDDKDKASKVSRVPAIEPPPTNSAISGLVDQIVERFPVESATIVLFAGTEQTSNTDETCARVAAELAGRNMGSILLVDSDFDNRNLTIASGMRDKPGVREIVAMGLDWDRTVLQNKNSKLDFMPAGVTKQSRWNANKQLHKATAKMKNDYQFICVSIGDAHGKAAKLWSEVCDATYLLVSVENSNQDVAKSAVKALNEAGARLQGCIVTETS